MDSAALVSHDRIESTGEFLKRLPAQGLTVTGALWAQVEGDEKPYLYILTPNAESEGQIEANLRVGRALREHNCAIPPTYRRLDPFAIKFVGPTEGLGQVLTQWYQEHNDSIPTIYRSPIIGRGSFVSLDEASIYPAALFSAPAAPPA